MDAGGMNAPKLWARYLPHCRSLLSVHDVTTPGEDPQCTVVRMYMPTVFKMGKIWYCHMPKNPTFCYLRNVGL